MQSTEDVYKTAKPGRDQTSNYLWTALPMSTPWILHRLYSLDPSSLDFLRNLRSLIRHDEQQKYLISLQGSQLARLVDFLDQVRAIHLAFFPLTKWIVQTLSTISADDDLSRKCLHRLQAICAYHATLPSSIVVSRGIVRVGRGPIALGGIADVWEGTYRGNRVSIKSMKIPLSGDQTIGKVCILCHTSLSRPLKEACGSCSHSSMRPSPGKG